MKFIIVASVLILFSVYVARAQNEGIAKLSQSAAGKRVVAYFAAFNSGDEERLRAFFTENITPEALKTRPVEARLAFHKQIRVDFQTVEIRKIVSASETSISVLARSVNGAWIAYSFEFDPATGKVAAFDIEPTEPPGENETQGVTYPVPTNQTELVASVEHLFTDLAKADIFSGVVMVAKGDEPILAKAYGYADVDKKIPNKLDTRFNLGSINKNFTRLALGQLVKQGKLSFADKLIKILPDYPNREAAEKITIGQLVNMRSGIGDFFNDKFQAMDKSKLRTVKDYLPLFAGDPLEFEPGTKNRYSNGGYIVLGLVIEKLSGKSYYDYVRDNIFKPAGMTNTDSYALDSLLPDTAYGYTGTGPKRTTNMLSLPGRGSSAGGGYSTAGDLLKYSIALRSKKLVLPDDNGGFSAEFNGVGVAGGSPGVNAIFITDEKTGYTIIVLSNYDPPSAERPASQIRDWLKQIKL